MFPRNENRNKSTFACSPGTKTGTRVRSHVPPERKPERRYIRQNRQITKPPAVEFWWKMLLPIFPCKRSSKISFQTSPEVRHQFRRKLRQLHPGNRWRLDLGSQLHWFGTHQLRFFNAFRIVSPTCLLSLKKSGGTTPEVEKPPRASRRKIAP